jgi:hypothetical protein
MSGCGGYLTGSRCGPVTEYFENGSEPVGSIRTRGFLNHPIDKWPHKEEHHTLKVPKLSKLIKKSKVSCKIIGKFETENQKNSKAF